MDHENKIEFPRIPSKVLDFAPIFKTVDSLIALNFMGKSI